MTLIDKIIKSLVPVSIIIFIGSVLVIEGSRTERFELILVSLLIIFFAMFLQLRYIYKKSSEKLS